MSDTPPTRVNLDFVPRISDSIMASEVGESIAMMDLNKGSYFGLDRVGVEIWRNINGSNSVRDICLALEESFDVSAEVCQNDTLELVQELLDHGLVEQ